MRRAPGRPVRARRLRLGLPVLVAVVLTAAACGGSPTAGSSGPGTAPAAAATARPWDGLTGAAREQALVEAAKGEGRLSVYSGFNDEPAMAEAFTKKYGIQVDVYNANSETVLQRVLQERSASKALNDVLINPSPDMQAAQTEGVLGTYASPYRDAIPDSGRGERWTAVRRLAFVAGWNTSKVPPGGVPADYSGFADAKWAGRVSLELADVDWYATLQDYYLDKGMSRQDVDAMFRAIAANSKTAKGHTVQGQLLAAGQFDVALSLYTQTVERLESKGAPVTYGAAADSVVEPVVVRYDAGGLMQQPDNPASATLYLDFQLSEPGFGVDTALGALPPLPQADDPLGSAEVVALDTASFVQRRTELAAEYEALLRTSASAG